MREVAYILDVWWTGVIYTFAEVNNALYGINTFPDGIKSFSKGQNGGNCTGGLRVVSCEL